MKKITSSKTLITKYNTLLEQVSSSFQTNINPELMTSVAKYQIDKMPSWNIKKYSLNGYDSSNYTYSFGSQLLYVMEPNYETVETASNYINGMLNGKLLEELN